jgi:hypothetical protein
MTSPTVRSATAIAPSIIRRVSAAIRPSACTSRSNSTRSSRVVRDQRMADHIAALEERETDAIHAVQHFDRMAQPGLVLARQIDLGHVAGDHRRGAEADARQEHLHLLDGGVLRLVQDHEGVVQRAPAHVGQRRDLDDVALEQRVTFSTPSIS